MAYRDRGARARLRRRRARSTRSSPPTRSGWARIKEGRVAAELPEDAFTYYPSGFVGQELRPQRARASWTASNEIIGGLQADGTLKRLSMKWFGADYATKAQEYDIDSIGQKVK